jgi:hypothetical protein
VLTFLISFYLFGIQRLRNWNIYRGADKSLARPTSRCILFDGENISFDASLVFIFIYIYIYSTNIPPIMIINRIYEHQNLLPVVCFLPGRAKDLSAPLYIAALLDKNTVVKLMEYHRSLK